MATAGYLEAGLRARSRRMLSHVSSNQRLGWLWPSHGVMMGGLSSTYRCAEEALLSIHVYDKGRRNLLTGEDPLLAYEAVLCRIDGDR